MKVNLKTSFTNNAKVKVNIFFAIIKIIPIQIFAPTTVINCSNKQLIYHC